MKLVNILLAGNQEPELTALERLLGATTGNKVYRVTRCGTYPEAINAMLKSRFEAYLLYEKVQGYEGLDLLHEAIRSNCTEPIIFLGEHYNKETDETAMNLGAAAYFSIDSISGHVLDSCIRYAIKNSRSFSALKASEDKFRIIFERSKDPMFVTDISGKHYDVNDAALEYFETTRAEFLRANAASFYTDEYQRDRYVTEMERNGFVTGHEISLKLANGGLRYSSISSFLQISQHGSLKLYYVTLHDITALKARKAQPDGTVLLADQIRNPLTAVNLAVDEICAQLHGQPQDVKYYLSIVKENCDKINQLTKFR
ncbi:PAS domain-containing protein [Hufsiella ginkgonis]|uniref:PAS domain S-box protein n=1 Tax=Hufsiella ginkgonis TaxID=2695274 RepID=A0A7K1XUH0_9SPHI|nr:PAS domain-containing protein [Hufsiella ginkgonis]MXV14136.1 PAS domain S-box protein [Hufsiella ginkgonis]